MTREPTLGHHPGGPYDPNIVHPEKPWSAERCAQQARERRERELRREADEHRARQP